MATPPASYGTADELFRRLKIRAPTDDQQAAAGRVLSAAAGEVDLRMGRIDELAAWELDFVTEVHLERAVELWREGESPFGLIGVGGESGPVFVSRSSRALAKLAELQQSWGIA